MLIPWLTKSRSCSRKRNCGRFSLTLSLTRQAHSPLQAFCITVSLPIPSRLNTRALMTEFINSGMELWIKQRESGAYRDLEHLFDDVMNCENCDQPTEDLFHIKCKHICCSSCLESGEINLEDENSPEEVSK